MLSVKQCPKYEEDKMIMKSTLYSSEVGNIIYGNIYSQHSKLIMTIFGQAYWETLKWVLRYLNGSLKVSLKYTK